MHSLVESAVVFAIVFGGALAGMAIRRMLPPELLGIEVKETVRLAIGLVVTMTGLVLGMLVSSAKTFYDGQKRQVSEMSSEIILLSDLLKSYGPEAEQARILTRRSTEEAADRIWPKERSQRAELRPRQYAQEADAQLRLLVPKNSDQATLKSQMPPLVLKLKQTNWLLYLDSEQNSLSTPLLVVVTSWLTIIFISFGLFVPPRATVIVTLLICAVAVSAAVFIITAMYSPFNGVFAISPAPVRDALNQMSADQ
jgi:hypothetical protein